MLTTLRPQRAVVDMRRVRRRLIAAAGLGVCIAACATEGSGIAQSVKELSAPEQARRVTAVRMLGDLGPGAVQSVPALLEALRSPANRSIRPEIAQALGRIGSETAVSTLEEALTDSEALVRLEAALALRKIGRATGLSVLIEVLENGDAAVRTLAAASVCAADWMASIDLVKALMRRLEDQDADVRALASAALGCIGEDAKQAISFLEYLGSSGDDEHVREHASIAIAAIRRDDPSSMDVLLSESLNEHSDVRFAAVRALGRAATRTPLVIRALERASSDDSDDVRAEAAEGLGRIGPAAKASTHVLKEMLKDKEPKVRRAAAEALKKVSGQEH